MKIVKIPKQYSITLEGEEILTEDRILISIDLGGGLFRRPFAQLSIYDKGTNTIGGGLYSTFGGKWEVRIDGRLVFKGFAAKPQKTRKMGANVWDLELKGTIDAWDVLLTNTTFGSGAQVDHAVGTMTQYIQYLVNTVAGMSGIPFSGNVPSKDVNFSDIYQDSILSVQHSTYLAEIQKACQSLGYIVFNDPAGSIRIIDAQNPPSGIIFSGSEHSKEIINAFFTENMNTIPATVLVNDDVSSKGYAYGHLGTQEGADSMNFTETGINNIVFASTVGMKDDALKTIAKNIYNISRKASKMVHVEWAGIPETPYILGYEMSWSGGTYIIKNYEIVIDSGQVKTIFEGYKA